VLASAYEEDLPRLDALKATDRHWSISLPSRPDEPARDGSIEQIGHIIDPYQHTAAVMGWVDDPDAHLRAGQFITATVTLLPPENEVVLPASALIEKGGQNLIFVQSPDGKTFTQRQVSLSRQVGDRVCFHIVPPAVPDAAVIPGQLSGVQPQERIVVSGAVELQQSLTDLTAAAQATIGQSAGPIEPAKVTP
jgi:multidrug efflux pump subunit AcrA (membrane-fusion protein)